MERIEREEEKVGLIKLLVDAASAGTGLDLRSEDFEWSNKIIRDASTRIRLHIIEIVFGQKWLSPQGEEIVPKIRLKRSLDNRIFIVGGNVPLNSAFGSSLSRAQVVSLIAGMNQLFKEAEVSKNALSAREQMAALKSKQDRRF